MVDEGGVDEYTGSSGQDILMAGISASSTLYGGDGQDIMIGDTYNKETTFELGNRDGVDKWDQVSDIIQGFGSNDELDLSNLGIIEGDLTTDGNKLLANDVQIVEFTNFQNGFTIDDMFNDANYITYADVV